MNETPQRPQRPTTAAELDDRYGRTSTAGGALRTRWTLLLAVVALVGAMVAVWAFWFHAPDPLQAGVSAFRVTGDHELQVRIQFRADPEVTGACVYRASADDHQAVGERTITVAEMRESSDGWFSIRTERRATTVQQLRCTST